MKQVQKRYLYSGLVSGIFFIIVYGIMNFNLFVSLILTVCLYIGGILLFKSKDIRVMDAQTIEHYYFWASKCANRASLTNDVEIKETVEKITTYTDEIIVSLSQRPKKVEQVFDFFDYYIDITYKILYRYNSLKNNSNLTKKDQEFLDNTKKYLNSIQEAFKKQLLNMTEARMLDIESEIRMFEKTVGIKKTDMEVDDNNESR